MLLEGVALKVLKRGVSQMQVQGLKYLKPNVPNTHDVN